MKRALPLLLLLLGSAAAGPDDEADRRAFLELAAPRADCYVGEAVPVTLRVVLDRAFFRDQAVPIFARDMDFPVHVRAEFLAGVRGAVLLPERPPADPVRTLGVNDAVAAAREAPDRTIAGRPFAVLEIRRTMVFEAPGTAGLPAPVLRFAYATSFEEDFLRGRRPLDRREAVVTGRPLSLTVRALPAEDRPPAFGGAIGRFSVVAEAAPRRVAAGETLRLRLGVTGDGNLSRFPPPPLDPLPGFHVYGVIEEGGSEGRTFVYDIAALSPDVDAVPPVPFAFFDPSPPAGYRVLRTEPIPLEVGPGGGVSSAPDLSPRGDGAAPAWLLPLAVAAGLLGVAAAAAVPLARRARARRLAREEQSRVEAVTATLVARTLDEDADLAEAIVEFLAFHLRCLGAAVVSPDLAVRLRAAGVPAALAERTAGLLERLTAARYGGRRSVGAPEETRRVGEALATAFREATTRGRTA